MIRKAAKVARRKCGIYIDLHGPKIKVGQLEKDKESIKIPAGQQYLFYCKKKFVGNECCMGIECSDLAKHLKVGDHIIVDHGKAIFRVTGFKDEDEFIA
jgi:pyruvate kinase